MITRTQFLRHLAAVVLAASGAAYASSGVTLYQDPG
jgi:hypothetical protein